MAIVVVPIWRVVLRLRGVLIGMIRRVGEWRGRIPARHGLPVTSLAGAHRMKRKRDAVNSSLSLLSLPFVVVVVAGWLDGIQDGQKLEAAAVGRLGRQTVRWQKKDGREGRLANRGRRANKNR